MAIVFLKSTVGQKNMMFDHCSALAVHRQCSRVYVRVAKCHGYGGYIRVKILAGWGKKSGRKTVLQKQVLFWVNLSN